MLSFRSPDMSIPRICSHALYTKSEKELLHAFVSSFILTDAPFWPLPHISNSLSPVVGLHASVAIRYTTWNSRFPLFLFSAILTASHKSLLFVPVFIYSSLFKKIPDHFSLILTIKKFNFCMDCDKKHTTLDPTINPHHTNKHYN